MLPKTHLHECQACSERGIRHHACAFLSGRFHPANWRCGALDRLEAHAAVILGSEVETLLIEGQDGSVVVLYRRVGQPQRVRHAYVVRPNLTITELTSDFLLTFNPKH